jgi:hypothetical protein
MSERTTFAVTARFFDEVQDFLFIREEGIDERKVGTDMNLLLSCQLDR